MRKWFIKNDTTKKIYVVESEKYENSRNVLTQFIETMEQYEDMLSIHNDINFFIGEDKQLYRSAVASPWYDISNKKITEDYETLVVCDDKGDVFNLLKAMKII